MLRTAVFGALSLSLFVSVNGCHVDRRPQLAAREASPILQCPSEHLISRPLGNGRYAVEGCGHGVFVICQTTYEHGTTCVLDDMPKVASLAPPAATAPWFVPPPAPFDADVARAVLEHVRYADCGAGGAVKLELTFATDGSVSEARVAEGSLSDTVTTCVLDRFLGARVRAFSGEPHKVSWRIQLATVPGALVPAALPEGAIEI